MSSNGQQESWGFATANKKTRVSVLVFIRFYLVTNTNNF